MKFSLPEVIPPTPYHLANSASSQVSDQTTLPLEASLDPLRFPEVPCWLLAQCLPVPDYSTYHSVPVMPAYQSSVSISPKGHSPAERSSNGVGNEHVLNG